MAAADMPGELGSPERMAFLWSLPATVELTHNHGSEAAEGAVYHAGNNYDGVNEGFGHLGITVRTTAPAVNGSSAHAHVSAGGSGAERVRRLRPLQGARRDLSKVSQQRRHEGWWMGVCGAPLRAAAVQVHGRGCPNDTLARLARAWRSSRTPTGTGSRSSTKAHPRRSGLWTAAGSPSTVEGVTRAAEAGANKQGAPVVKPLSKHARRE
jgi:hypothetical protein